MAYMFVLWTSMQTDHDNSIFGFTHKCRAIWVEVYLSKPKHGVTAIQAIRNEILTLLFIGEFSFSAVTVIISVSSALDLTCTMKAMESHDPITGGFEQWLSPMSKIKLIITLLTGIFALTLQSLRLLRHASVITACSGTEASEEAKSVLFNLHSRITSFNFFGTRFIYLLIPALALLLGPTFCLGATVLTTAFMHATDHISLPKPRKLLKEVRRRGSVLASGAAGAARDTARISTEFIRDNSAPAGALRRSIEMVCSLSGRFERDCEPATPHTARARDGQGEIA
eukprot:CAMPEP_0177712238 /NCGR_PEP_ID=MMETSP0484_2-20121128/12293_1 /TAXON_ID=354590 /ORGANISM="Rhodomonas lens, Strain RHODO" /LENGTH=283 /DNA_ID=CAMNT_0019224035 /DNA_START=241 /DNA_END=1092 /DNA_ORIENTATION=-